MQETPNSEGVFGPLINHITENVRERAKSYSKQTQAAKIDSISLNKLVPTPTYDLQQNGAVFERYVATYFLLNIGTSLGENLYIHGSFGSLGDGKWGPSLMLEPAQGFPSGWYFAKAKCEEKFEFLISNRPELNMKDPEAMYIQDPDTGRNFSITDRTRVVLVTR